MSGDEWQLAAGGGIEPVDGFRKINDISSILFNTMIQRVLDGYYSFLR